MKRSLFCSLCLVLLVVFSACSPKTESLATTPTTPPTSEVHETAPTTPPTTEKIPNIQELLSLGEQHLLEHDYENALDCYLQVLKSDPENEQALDTTINIYMERGLESIQDGKTAENLLNAQLAFESVLALDDEYDSAWFGLYVCREDYEAAVAFYEDVAANGGEDAIVKIQSIFDEFEPEITLFKEEEAAKNGLSEAQKADLIAQIKDFEKKIFFLANPDGMANKDKNNERAMADMIFLFYADYNPRVEFGYAIPVSEFRKLSLRFWGIDLTDYVRKYPWGMGYVDDNTSIAYLMPAHGSFMADISHENEHFNFIGREYVEYSYTKRVTSGEELLWKVSWVLRCAIINEDGNLYVQFDEWKEK